MNTQKRQQQQKRQSQKQQKRQLIFKILNIKTLNDLKNYITPKKANFNLKHNTSSELETVITGIKVIKNEIMETEHFREHTNRYDSLISMLEQIKKEREKEEKENKQYLKIFGKQRIKDIENWTRRDYEKALEDKTVNEIQMFMNNEFRNLKNVLTKKTAYHMENDLKHIIQQRQQSQRKRSPQTKKQKKSDEQIRQQLRQDLRKQAKNEKIEKNKTQRINEMHSVPELNMDMQKLKSLTPENVEYFYEFFKKNFIKRYKALKGPLTDLELDDLTLRKLFIELDKLDQRKRQQSQRERQQSQRKRQQSQGNCATDVEMEKTKTKECEKEKKEWKEKLEKAEKELKAFKNKEQRLQKRIPSNKTKKEQEEEEAYLLGTGKGQYRKLGTSLASKQMDSHYKKLYDKLVQEKRSYLTKERDYEMRLRNMEELRRKLISAEAELPELRKLKRDVKLKENRWLRNPEDDRTKRDYQEQKRRLESMERARQEVSYSELVKELTKDRDTIKKLLTSNKEKMKFIEELVNDYDTMYHDYNRCVTILKQEYSPSVKRRSKQ